MSNFPLQSGTIESIHIAAAAGGPMTAVEACAAMPGKGLAGDRYFNAGGTYSDWPKDHELTLVEAETLDGLAAKGFVLAPGESRRNLTTRGIALNDLVEKEFTVGQVRCRGTRLCHPCDYLESLLDRPGLVKAMAMKGGLRAVILTAGAFAVGDTITVLEPSLQPSPR